MSEEAKAGEITQAMLRVMRRVGVIGKEHRNQAQKYDFRGIEDFYNRLYPIMADEGVLTLPRVLETKEEPFTNKNGNSGWRVSLLVEYIFQAADGSTVQTIAAGEAQDFGDKATCQAMAQAHKYALQQIFMIPTEGETLADPRPAPKKETRKEDPLKAAKRGLLKLVAELRKEAPKDMDDKTWIKRVCSQEVGKETIATEEELVQVKKAVESNLYAFDNGEQIPF